MKYAVMGGMAFQNAARRDNAHQFVVNRLSAESMWQTVTVDDTTYLGQPAIFCNFRFVNQAARDVFWTDLMAQLAGVNGPVVGSWAAKHDCPHDQPAGAPCVEAVRQVW